MMLYIYCRICPKKIYINFGQPPPLTREIIHRKYPNGFLITCPDGHEQLYYAREVMGEFTIGSGIAGAAMGALLFFVNPVLGTLGTFFGGGLTIQAEREQVILFNRS